MFYFPPTTNILPVCHMSSHTYAYLVLQDSGNSQVVFMPLDLASLKSVRSFAETFLKTEPRLDILINNAGEVFINQSLPN